MDIVIRRATEADHQVIAHIGRIAVEEAHRSSCSEEDMQQFLNATYNEAAIINELNDPLNIYHVISYKGQIVGFSKVILNAEHANIATAHVTKLDRIYLLKEYYDLKLGYQLLNHNIAFSKENGENGMWLFTWVGNTRAVNFYKKTGFDIIGDHQFKVTETHYNANHHMYLQYEK